MTHYVTTRRLPPLPPVIQGDTFTHQASRSLWVGSWPGAYQGPDWERSILSPEYPPRIPTRTESRMIGDTVAEQRRHFRYMRTSPLVTYEWHRDIRGERRPFPVHLIRYHDTITHRNTYGLES